MAKIQLQSAGKAEVLSGKISADLFLDCRILWNPYREPSLAGLTGDDHQIQEWILVNNKTALHNMVDLIHLGLSTRSTRNSGKDPGKPFRVCFFCLAGVHRSRGMKHCIGRLLSLTHDVEIL